MRKKFVSGVIAKFDKDGDGKLDEAELTEFLEDQRKAFESCRRPERPPRDFNVPKEILAKFDKDGDGFLNTARAQGDVRAGSPKARRTL